MSEILKKLKIANLQFEQFGTEIDFQIVLEDSSFEERAQRDLAKARELCEKFELIFSRFNEKSELSKLNNKLGMSTIVSPLFCEVAKLVLEKHEESEGYFDPRIIEKLENIGYDRDFSEISTTSDFQENFYPVKMGSLSDDLIVSGNKVAFGVKMDFSGFVKGFVVDYVSNFFLAGGWKNFLVDCGGDMFFAGRDSNSNPWYIDIEGVQFQSLMFELSDMGIATSGIGKRKWENQGKRVHHLINPEFPDEFSFDLKSVTVIDKLTQRADVLAKTIFLMGKEKGIAFAEKKNIPCAILDYKGGLIISSEIKKYLH